MHSTVCSTATLAACLLLVFPARGGDPDEANFQGAWEFQSIELCHERNWAKGFRIHLEYYAVFAIENRTVVATWFHAKNPPTRLTFELDSSKRPKKIDLHFCIDGRDVTMEGIYSLKDSILQLCIGERGETRPTEFAVEESRQSLFTFRRLAVDSDLARIQGIWELESLRLAPEETGDMEQAQAVEEIPSVPVSICGRILDSWPISPPNWLFGGRPCGSRFELDPEKKPQEIYFAHLGPIRAPGVLAKRATYTIDKDTLSICFVERRSSDEDGQSRDVPVLVTFRRVQPDEARTLSRVTQPHGVPDKNRDKQRTWHDDSGKFSIKAEFMSYSMGRVKLRREDGSEVEVDVQRLSEEDREFLREKFPKRGVRPPF